MIGALTIGFIAKWFSICLFFATALPWKSSNQQQDHSLSSYFRPNATYTIWETKTIIRSSEFWTNSTRTSSEFLQHLESSKVGTHIRWPEFQRGATGIRNTNGWRNFQQWMSWSTAACDRLRSSRAWNHGVRNSGNRRGSEKRSLMAPANEESRTSAACYVRAGILSRASSSFRLVPDSVLNGDRDSEATRTIGILRACLERASNRANRAAS
jgi:hypothetical protein